MKKPNFSRKGIGVAIKSRQHFWSLIDECKTEPDFLRLQPKLIAYINENWGSPGNAEWAEKITRLMWTDPQNVYWAREQ